MFWPLKQLVVDIQLVLSHLTVRLDERGESPRHTLDKVLTQLQTHPLMPHSSDLHLEPVQVGGVDVLELLLDAVPEVLDRVEVRRIPRPVDQVPSLLLEPRFHSLGLVTRCSILQKLRGPGLLHGRCSLGLEHLQILLSIHGLPLGKKKDLATPLPGERTPNHDMATVLHSLDGELWVKTVCPLEPAG